MTHQVLARKWRPKGFSEVVGQDHVVQALANALDTGRIHHAYLFTGTRGVGKTTLARILAKALNCEGPDGSGGMTSKPCGVCRACTEIDAGRFVDLLEVDAATNTKVDEMRELLETAQYMPVSGRYKVYIIDEVHMLSKSAFNSMLKTLEEPPGHVQFILATTDPQKLPVTVLSRCLQFNLKQLPAALIAQHLKAVLGKEQVPCEDAALLMIGKAAEGSVRDSLSLLDQAIAYGSGKVTADGVAGMLGALDQTYLFAVLERLAEGDAAGVMREVDAMSARSLSFDMALRDIAALLHRLALVQSAPDAATDEAQDGARIQALAQQFSPEQVQLFYQIAILGRRDLPLAPDEHAGISMTLLRMLALGSSQQQGMSARPAAKATTPVAATGAPAHSPATIQRPRPEAAPSATSSTASAVPDFDGDWPGLVTRLNLSSMAGMLGRQCELVSFQDNILELTLPEAQKHLLDKAYVDKLKAALEPHFKPGLRVNIRTGMAEGKSVAAVEQRVMAAQQSKAVQSIENDAFVKDLIADFGVELNTASIKPVS